MTLPHSRAEDVLGLLTGTFLAALGLHFLHAAHAVTGGTTGLALLISYAVAWSLPVVLVAINVPFFALAWWLKGLSFTVRSMISVGLLSAFTALHAHVFTVPDITSAWSIITGNLLAGVGILVLFRHGASLGGFSVVALIAQDRFGWRAGYVQMSLDVAVIGAAIAIVPLDLVALSAVGAVVLNLVLALNHRPGRYQA